MTVTAVTLLKWEAVAFRRRVRELLGTGRGLLGLVFLVLASPSLYQLARADRVEGVALSPLALEGAANLSHAALLAFFAALVATTAVRVFVVTRQPEALSVMGWCVPSLALHRVVIRILLPAALTACAFFAIFAGQTLLTASNRSPVFFAAYVPALALGLAAVAAAAFLTARRQWRQGRGWFSSSVILHGGFCLSLICFGVMAGLSDWLAHNQPAALEAAGRAGRRSANLGQLPLTAAFTAAGARWPVLVLALAALGCAAGAGVLALRRWSAVNGSELVGEMAAATGVHPSLFGSRRRPARARRRFVLFWTKDVRASYTRVSRRYALEQWSLAGTSVFLLGIAAWTTTPESRSAALRIQPMFLALACTVAFAALRGLGSLGSEAHQIRLLRPVLRPLEFFRIKARVNTLFVAAHAAAYGWLLAGVAALLGVHPNLSGWSVFGAGALAALAGLAFATLATAIGFLMPVFSEGQTLVPGASRAGAMLYLSIALPASAIVAVTWGLDRRGSAAGLAFELAILLGVFILGWGVRAWSLSRLDSLEV